MGGRSAPVMTLVGLSGRCVRTRAATMSSKVLGGFGKDGCRVSRATDERRRQRVRGRKWHRVGI